MEGGARPEGIIICEVESPGAWGRRGCVAPRKPFCCGRIAVAAAAVVVVVEADGTEVFFFLEPFSEGSEVRCLFLMTSVFMDTGRCSLCNFMYRPQALHKTSPCSFRLQSGVVDVPQFEHSRSSEGLPSFRRGGCYSEKRGGLSEKEQEKKKKSKKSTLGRAWLCILM